MLLVSGKITFSDSRPEEPGSISRPGPSVS